MTPVFFLNDFYKKMLELQEKLRKSEEERIRLEERFNLLEQESRVRHEVCINKLRMRYIEFLEEQRLRDQRNHKLLGTLDKVDTSLALMSAKTDRLYTLKKEYEASLLRAQANRRQAGSVTGDSGIISQNDDRLMRRGASSNVTPSYHLDNLKTPTPRAAYSVQENYYNSISTPKKSYSALPPLQFASKTSAYENSSESFLRAVPSVDYQRAYGIKSLAQEPEIKTWNDDYTSGFNKLRRDLRKDYLSRESGAFKYPERLTTLGSSKLTNLLGKPLSGKEQLEAGSVVEKELESYINKIRSLHDNNNDQHSLEEVDHEQNTSGDLLNVTLSDDGFDHLPVEEKVKGHVQAEVGQILALAEDLAAKTAADGNLLETCTPVNVVLTNENPPADPNAVQEVQSKSNDPSAFINETVIEPEMQSAVKKDISGLNADDGLNDISKSNMELRDDENKVVEQPKTVEGISEKEDNSNEKDYLINPEVSKPEILCSKEQEVDNFQVTTELEPWDVNNFVKEITEVDDSNLNENNSEEKSESVSFSTTNHSAMDKEILKTEVDEIPAVNPELVTDGKNIAEAEHVYEENYAEVVEETLDQTKEYPEAAEPVYEYQQGYQDPSQYQYDPSAQYDSNAGEYQYQQQYPYDPNAEYHDQQYTDDQNQQYAQDPNQQYQYTEDPGQYPEAYTQDPNYDPNYEYPAQQYEAAYESPDQAQAYTEQSNQENLQPDHVEPEVNHPPEDLVIKASDLDESAADSSKNDKNDSNGRAKKTKDKIRAILDSDTESTIEKNTSNTESDFDFN
ncbi:uncharacterized protein LOC103572414 [Microplitis demolitor]|uniref:uncharacterized protein LOC103572414 n=1 Tax=Microplitis demolitor TaxID=69319 RepID=UPI0004CCF50E|nr:uncharacterized protein LOC103572414 [Microplitis demolitor]